jgi:integrase
MFPSLTTYWARHSWATIAASLDVPDDTISLALGHSARNATTAMYIERDLRKVDAANRRIIDYVFNGKK